MTGASSGPDTSFRQFDRWLASANPDGTHQFTAVLASLPIAIYTTDVTGKITFYNEAAAKLWGRRPNLASDDSRWCGSWRLYRSDGTPLPHYECPMAITLKTGSPVRGVKAIAERPDGTRVPFMPYPTPLFNAEGRLSGAVNLLVDLADVEQAEGDARRLAAIVEYSDDAIISKDLNGTILSWNRGAERLFGYKPEEVMGKSITVVIPADLHNEETTILSRIRHGELVDHYETIRQRKDGSKIDVSLSVSPLKDGAGRIVGASKIARDISERKHEQEKQALLVAEMKHRIKNMLATVQAIAAMTLKDASKNERDAFISRLHSLANAYDILAGDEWDKAQVSEIVTRTLEPFAAASRLKTEGEDVWIPAKKSMLLSLALHELTTNAVKYGALSNGSGIVSIEWTAIKGDRSGLLLEWTETGGPPVSQPDHKGFGSLLIERALRSELGEARLDFNPSGLHCELKIAL